MVPAQAHHSLGLTGGRTDARGRLRRALAFLAVAATAGAAGCGRSSPAASGPPLADPVLRHGREVFLADCAPCHGDDGRGDGPVARAQPVRPRDFVAGQFKFVSGPPGSLPTEADLLRTVTLGVPTSTMPSFSMLPESDRRAVVRYVETFCPRFGVKAR